MSNWNSSTRKFTRKGAWNLMKPTTKKAVKRPAKKRNPTVTKLLDLKYRINDAYRNNGFEFTRDDKDWVMEQIDMVRNGIILGKEEMLTANDLWRKYK
tara:strand:+ start:161 stop:454 length:294 start_codon:yes stop_codon:yes gene_type:complete